MLIAEVFKDKGPIKWNCKALAQHIMGKAKVHSLNSRSVYVSNEKLLKKAEKVKLASRSDTGMFAQQLLLMRRKAKHRGLRLMKPGDTDWFNIKEVTKMATEFSNEFSMPTKIGYREYIQLGLGMMKNFSVFKFKSIHSAICNKYEAIQEIEQDKSPEDTKKIHDFYIAIISEKVGYTQSYINQPEKYIYFIKAKEEARSIGISYKEYIKAQFGAFEWKSGIPDPMQLTGVKARDRVQRYAFENGIKIGKQNLINFKNIKHAKKVGTKEKG